MRNLSLATLAITLIAAAAQADTRPKVLPDRDVTMTVRSGSTTETVSYSAALRTFRRVQGNPAVFMLMDSQANTMRVVNGEQRVTVLLEGALLDGPLPWDPAMQFRRVGQDRVAGLACTEWQMTMPARRGAAPEDQGRVCLTADGVILRHGTAESGQVVTGITYAAQDPAGFRVPAGYRSVSMAEAARMQ